MTQKQLAEAVGCSVRTIRNAESTTNPRTPLRVYRERLEEVLGISLREVDDEETGQKHAPHF